MSNAFVRPVLGFGPELQNGVLLSHLTQRVVSTVYLINPDTNLLMIFLIEV